MAESQSCEALQTKTDKRYGEQKNGHLEEEDEEYDLEAEAEGEGEASQLSEFPGAQLLNGAEVREMQSETLAVAELKDNDRRDELLCAGLLENSTSELQRGSDLEMQVEVSHQEALPSSTTQCGETQTQNQLCSSASSPTVPEENLSGQKVNGISMPESNYQSSPDHKRVFDVPISKTPVSDGYNWRKYGQKQVKSPKGSRSYYRCTHSECHAKKVECSDDTGHIIEIVNKGLHSHEPPRKNICTRESRVVSSAGPVLGNSVTEQSIRMLNDSDPSTSSKESMREITVVPERKQQYSSCSERNGETEVKEHVRETEPKRRVKKEMDSPGSEVKPGKKPKFVLHAAGDLGISSDGYRWRKYGQKMVKGKPHPRNYYRCTSAGCPVRKHIETAVDDSNALIITYKGVHDHEMPVPKKRHGPPSALLAAAAAPAAMNNEQFKKTDTTENQITSTQWSVGTEGELTCEAMDLGGEKAMESARTLLSIGFEIKPC